MSEGYLLNELCEQGMPYIPSMPRTTEDDKALTWNAKLFESTKRTHCSMECFEKIFKETMTYITTTEHHMYMDIQRGNTTEREFIAWLRGYFNRTYPEMHNDNDFNIMYERLHTAVFQYYVLQPLIDHEDTSDIKVCAPDDIRVRVKGKAYKSTSCFLNEMDLFQFIEGLALRNGLDFSHPEITFTDTHDKNYILRFLVSAPAVNAVNYPYLHIRKVPKDKPDFDKLIKDEMLTPMVVEYVKDRIKTSKGIVISGPPGCVDCKTEFFNGSEWKSIADYKDGEQVLQFNVSTGIASLVTPEHYIKKPCSKMYHFKTNALDQMLSPEHRILYYDKKHPHVMLAEELYQRYRKYGLNDFDGRILTTFDWNFNNEDQTEDISFDDIFEMEEQFSPEWYKLPKPTLEKFTIYHGEPLKNQAFADFLQFVYEIAGFAVKVFKAEDNRYYLQATKKYASFCFNTVDTVITEVKPEDGFKYCFTVPDDTLVLRRNGKIFITKNSGKSTLLNANLEVIPKTRETLVIQENDELHTKQSGFMFKHVTHGFHGEPVITLEELGKMALVEGCNEFVIGEVKGGEMRYAATLMRSGGYCMYTTHSLSARETLPRCADLVKQGSDYSYEDACKMLKNVETVIFMEDYQVQEILEVLGYDVEKHDFIYRPIYKNPNPRYATRAAENASQTMQNATLQGVPQNSQSEKLTPDGVKKDGSEGDGVFINASDIPDFSSMLQNTATTNEE